jgi:hypothetical protein
VFPNKNSTTLARFYATRCRGACSRTNFFQRSAVLFFFGKILAGGIKPRKASSSPLFIGAKNKQRTPRGGSSPGKLGQYWEIRGSDRSNQRRWSKHLGNRNE